MNAARQLVFARDLWRCQARIDGVCPDGPHEGHHAHHVLPRSAGGPDTLDNLVLVCWPAHRWVHDHPAEATERGLLRSRYGRRAS